MKFKINSLYICVKDMDRAIGFYERLLDQEVTERDEVYSVFNIGGFRFGLFANEKMQEKHVFGDNCLPSFEVEDIKAVEERLSKLNSKIVFPLTKIKNNLVLEFADSEGNHIEVTSPVKKETIKLVPMTYDLNHKMYKNFTNDPNIFAENFHEFIYDEGKVDSKFYKDIEDKTRKVFAICLEGKEIPLGELKLKNIDFNKKECTMSIHLTNDTVKNKGYGTIAEKLALDYAFNNMGMKAVNADAILKNKRSQHVLMKVGFKYIGKDDDFKYYRYEL